MVAILTTKKTKPIVHGESRYYLVLCGFGSDFGEISPRIYLPKNMTIEVNRKAIEFNRTQSITL